MQRSRFSAEQITKILQESSERGAANEVARKYGISTKTISNWRTRFKGMQSDDVKKLRSLEDECARLKRVVARQAYDIECLKEINTKKW